MNINAEIKKALADDSVFPGLLDAFINHHLSQGRDEDDGDKLFDEFYRKIAKIHAENTAIAIDSFQESPIEKIFLRSLLLGFAKSDPLGLVIHQFSDDALEGIRQFRSYCQNFLEFANWWDEQEKPKKELAAFLDAQVDAKKMSKEERDYIGIITVRYYYLNMRDSVHLTLQPKFTDIKINKRGIRPDLYFWSLKDERFGLVVECDGFKYHSSHDSFSRDRKRDRALAAKGFQTLRFSGAEITNNPVETTKDILEMLEAKWGQDAGTAA